MDQQQSGAAQQQQLGLEEKLQNFWANQDQEIENLIDFKKHSLPYARVKKIMKANRDVKLISGETPVVFTKACEMFISELTLRAWNRAQENKRMTIQKSDVAAAVARTDAYEFLADVMRGEAAHPSGSGPGNTFPLGESSFSSWTSIGPRNAFPLGESSFSSWPGRSGPGNAFLLGESSFSSWPGSSGPGNAFPLRESSFNSWPSAGPGNAFPLGESSFSSWPSTGPGNASLLDESSGTALAPGLQSLNIPVMDPTLCAQMPQAPPDFQ